MRAEPGIGQYRAHVGVPADDASLDADRTGQRRRALLCAQLGVLGGRVERAAGVPRGREGGRDSGSRLSYDRDCQMAWTAATDCHVAATVIWQCYGSTDSGAGRCAVGLRETKMERTRRFIADDGVRPVRRARVRPHHDRADRRRGGGRHPHAVPLLLHQRGAGRQLRGQRPEHRDGGVPGPARRHAAARSALRGRRQCRADDRGELGAPARPVRDHLRRPRGCVPHWPTWTGAGASGWPRRSSGGRASPGTRCSPHWPRRTP